MLPLGGDELLLQRFVARSGGRARGDELLEVAGLRIRASDLARPFPDLLLEIGDLGATHLELRGRRLVPADHLGELRLELLDRGHRALPFTAGAGAWSCGHCGVTVIVTGSCHPLARATCFMSRAQARGSLSRSRSTWRSGVCGE